MNYAICSIGLGVRAALLALFVFAVLVSCNDVKTPTYRVTFVTASDSPAIPAQSVPRGSKATEPPAPTRKGYIFAGWYADDQYFNKFAFSSSITSNTTLYAKWEQVALGSHKVTFDVNEGKGAVDTQVILQGMKAAEPNPAPTREGYSLSGWYTNDKPDETFNFDTPITADLVLHARWRGSEARLLSFSFEAAYNTFSALSKAAAVATGEINEETYEVTVEPSPYLYNWSVESLKASFSLSPGATVRVASEAQQAHVTANSFAAVVKYEVTSEDGRAMQTYTVTILPQSRRAAIPDTSLKGYLRAILPSAFVNGKLDVDFAAKYDDKPINLANIEAPATSLDGIEFFTSLKSLSLVNTALAQVTLPKNTALEWLECSNNKELQSLDLSSNTALETLLYKNNPSLTALDLRGMRSVTKLDFSGSTTVLTTLSIHDNLKTNSAVKALKKDRGEALVISTYSAADGSTEYKETCADFDPNSGDNGACKDRAN